MSKILVACEESQVVCSAFRAKGDEAYSCDISPCSGGHPEWHIQKDVRDVLRHDIISPFNCEWEMVICFPPCTDLAVSGARWFKEKIEDGRQQISIRFFNFFTNLQNPKVAIENPIGIMSTLYRKPDQIIQPWQFGHGETKATCLWLKGLPLLNPTNIVEGREGKVWRMAPSEHRAKMRSKAWLKRAFDVVSVKFISPADIN
jgi:site-specific DNA-cytosine methylase